MSKEKTFLDFYQKYKNKSLSLIQEILSDMQDEMKQVGKRVTSEGFKVTNESTNNLKYAVLTQIKEEKSSNN